MALTAAEETYLTEKFGNTPFPDHDQTIFHMKGSLIEVNNYLYGGEESKVGPNVGNLSFYDENLNAVVMVIATEADEVAQFIGDDEGRIIAGLGE